MSFIKVDTNTNPIPEGVLNPKVFGFPSGGGGGGGSTTINEPKVNASGSHPAIMPEVPASIETDLVNFSAPFSGNLKALMMGFVSLPILAVPTTIFFYIDDLLVGQCHSMAGGNVSWGFIVNSTPIGLKTCTMSLFSPDETLTPLDASLSILEFLPS